MLAALKRARKAQWQRLQDCSEESRLRVLCDSAVARGQSLQSVLAHVRSETRHDHRMRRDERMKFEGLVKEYHSCSEAVATTQTLTDSVHGIKLYEACLVPEPSIGMKSLEFVPDTADMASRMSGWACNHGHVSNLGAALDIAWSRQISMICHDS